MGGKDLQARNRQPRTDSKTANDGQQDHKRKDGQALLSLNQTVSLLLVVVCLTLLAGIASLATPPVPLLVVNFLCEPFIIVLSNSVLGNFKAEFLLLNGL